MPLKDNLQILAEHAIPVEPGEEIVWIGKPEKSSWVLNGAWGIMAEWLFFAAFMGYSVLMAHFTKAEILWGESAIFFTVISTLSIYKFAKGLIYLKDTLYVVTDERLIIKTYSGYTTIISVQLNEIKEKEIRRSFIEKRRKTSTLAFYSGKMGTGDDSNTKVYDCFDSIENHKEVWELVEEQMEKSNR